MKKLAIAILIVGIVSLLLSTIFEEHYHPNVFWTAVAACFLALSFNSKKRTESD